MSLFAQNGQNPFELPNRPTEESPAPQNQEQGTANPFELDRPSIEATSSTEESPTPQNQEQDTANPFDLENIESPSEVAPPPSNTENPFEINRISINNSLEKEVAPSPVLQPSKNKVPVSDRNFRAGVSAFLLGLLALLITLYSPVIKQLYKAFLNDNMLKLKHREQGSFLNFSLLSLYIFFFLNAGLFCCLITKHLGWQGEDNWQLLFFCILGVTGIFVAKHLILRTLGAVFPIDKELRQYNFTIVVFNIILGITLLPFNLLITFGPEGLPKYLIYSALLVIALIYGFRIMRSLLIGSRYISMHKFHFFMYLCTVEIAPTLILVKLLLSIEG